MPVQNQMCPKYSAKSWVPSWPFPSAQAYTERILDGSSPSHKLHGSDYQLRGLKQSTCSSNFLYLSQGIWGITLGKESKPGLRVFSIFTLLLSPALLPTPNQNSCWTEQQICRRKDSMIKPILGSQVAKYGSESKAVPQDNKATRVRETAVPGGRDTPGMRHCILAGRHLNKTFEIWVPGPSRQHNSTQNPEGVWVHWFSPEYHWCPLVPMAVFQWPCLPSAQQSMPDWGQGLPGTGTTLHAGSVLTAILAGIKHCSF